jgi:hypothetical protein
VLGADVVVVEQAGLFLGQDDHPAGPVGESFEHKQTVSGTIHKNVEGLTKEKSNMTATALW